MKRLLSLFLLIPQLLLAQMTVRGNIAATTPSLNLDFTKGTMPAGLSFSRNSVATRTNAQGVIEQVAVNVPRIDYDASVAVGQNLLPNSENLSSSTWEKNSVTLASSSTVTSPQGLTVAKVTETAATSAHWVNFNYPTNGLVTYSIYAKAAERSWLWAYFSGYTSGSAWFNLTTGTIGNVEPGVTAAVETLGNGWYRCSISKKNATASGSCAANLTTGNGATSYAGDGSSGLYLWGAQINDGTVATNYSKTSSTAIAAATLPVCRGLLVEEQRTNYYLQSENVINSTYGENASLSTVAGVRNPGGTMGAAFLSETATVAYHRGGKGFPAGTLPANTPTTLSCYVRANGRRLFALNFDGGGWGNQLARFDLATGQLLGVNNGGTATIQPVGDSWYRISLSATTNANANINGPALYFEMNGDAGDRSYQGNGTSGVFIWGVQFEYGSFSTSYIPTTTAAVTRLADDCRMTSISAWYNPTQSTFVAEALPLDTRENRGVFSINQAGNSGSNRIDLRTIAGNTFITVSGVNQSAPSGGYITPGVLQRWSFSVITSVATISRNGSNFAVAYGASLPNVNQLQVGNLDDNTIQAFNGYIRKFTYYPRRFADNLLKSLSQ